MSIEQYIDDDRTERAVTLIGYWLATGLLVVPGLALVLRVMLIDEPTVTPVVIALVVSIPIAGWCYRSRGTLQLRSLFVWGLTTAFGVGILGWVTETVLTRLSGSLYFTLVALLGWFSAGAVGWVVGRTDSVRNEAAETNG
ncbi:hypothetical protein [Halocatena halophila]|uniref:hypothetical protein n=1 Tax=Halocatena halophila TaxID=2814576 RepID=UPI002ED00E23